MVVWMRDAAGEQELAALLVGGAEAGVVEDELLDLLDEVRRRVALVEHRHVGRQGERLGHGRVVDRLVDQAPGRASASSTRSRRSTAGSGSVRTGRSCRGSWMSPASSADSATVSSASGLPKYSSAAADHAVGAVAEVDGVEVQLEDALLRVALLELPGERGLGHLAVEGLVRAEQQQLHQLLGDRGAALGDLALGGVHLHGADDGPQVDAAVEPEALVLDGDRRRRSAMPGSRRARHCSGSPRRGG